MATKQDVECDRCGCRDLRAVDKYMGETTYECNHCRHKTIAGISPYGTETAVYRHTRCIYCESENNKIVSGPRETRKHGDSTRHHYCYDCKVNFASAPEKE